MLEHIRQRERAGREVAVVTSNGVIGACVRRALGAIDGKRMRVHNASVTRIDVVAVGLRATRSRRDRAPDGSRLHLTLL